MVQFFTVSAGTPGLLSAGAAVPLRGGEGLGAWGRVAGRVLLGIDQAN